MKNKSLIVGVITVLVLIGISIYAADKTGIVGKSDEQKQAELAGITEARAIITDKHGEAVVFVDEAGKVHGHMRQKSFLGISMGWTVEPETVQLTKKQLAYRMKIESDFLQAKAEKMKKESEALAPNQKLASK